MIDAQLGSAPDRAPSLVPSSEGRDWYCEHEALATRLLHLAVEAACRPGGAKDVDQAFYALLTHAQTFACGAPFVVLARDSQNTIPYDKLAEARAKVRVLMSELEHVRAELAESNLAVRLESKPGPLAHEALRLLADDTEGGEP